jgi:hypothetical protein
MYDEITEVALIEQVYLNRRGWVFQERLLSPRIIHFGQDLLHWECSTQPFASERYPDGFSNGDLFNAFLRRFQMEFNLSKGNPLEAHACFVRMIEAYTRRQLTFPNRDKFAAFSAVAEHYSVSTRALRISPKERETHLAPLVLYNDGMLDRC